MKMVQTSKYKPPIRFRVENLLNSAINKGCGYKFIINHATIFFIFFLEINFDLPYTKNDMK